jgi:hypothetical protein
LLGKVTRAQARRSAASTTSHLLDSAVERANLGAPKRAQSALANVAAAPASTLSSKRACTPPCEPQHGNTAGCSKCRWRGCGRCRAAPASERRSTTPAPESTTPAADAEVTHKTSGQQAEPRSAQQQPAASAAQHTVAWHTDDADAAAGNTDPALTPQHANATVSNAAAPCAAQANAVATPGGAKRAGMRAALQSPLAAAIAKPVPTPRASCSPVLPFANSGTTAQVVSWGHEVQRSSWCVHYAAAAVGDTCIGQGNAVELQAMCRGGAPMMLRVRYFSTVQKYSLWACGTCYTFAACTVSSVAVFRQQVQKSEPVAVSMTLSSS